MFSFAALIASAVVFGGCKAKVEGTTGSADSSKTKAAAMSPVERGKYLVTIIGCEHCHTPWKMGEKGPELDNSRMLSGHPEAMIMPPPPKMGMPWMAAIAATFTSFTGPFGTSYSKNLTPDTSGLGKWDETTFMLAIRNGKHMGNGRPIMPPMPWQNIREATDDDLKAIFAYLKTIPPIKNNPPEYQPPAGVPMAGGGMPPGAPGGMKKK